jgi:hypothetical protein
MENRINRDGIRRWLVEKLEWETPDQRTAKLIHRHGIKLWVPLNRASSVKITFSIILRSSPLLHLVPSATGCGVLEITLLAPTQFLPLRVGNRGGLIFLGQTVPEILDQLQTFRASQFEKRRKFRVHSCSILIFPLFGNR